MELMAGLPVNVVLVCLTYLVARAPVLESHNHHRGYGNKAKHVNQSTPASASLEVSNNEVLEEEQEPPVFTDDLVSQEEEGRSSNVPSQEAVNAEILLLLRSMTTEIDGLRNQVSNLKLQNHLVYKTLRRMQSKCVPPTAPMIHSGE